MSSPPPPIASPSVVRNGASLDGSLHRRTFKDFRNFQHRAWMTWFNNPPTKRMYEVGERLQHGPSKDIVMGFRGLSKSFITVTYAVWALDVDPTEIVLALSGSDGGAKGNAILAWGMISQWDWLAHMKPTGALRQSSQAFDVAGSRMEKSESFAAMSLFGQLTSRRCSIAVPDDVETPNTSETQGDRDRLRVRYAEIGGALLKPGGMIKVLGTPQHEQTIYKELVEEKGYGLRVWPILYPVTSADPKKDELKHYGVHLAPTILKEITENPHLAGLSTEPSRFTEADIAARLLEYGSTEFERQFKLWMDAGSGVSNPLKLRDIPVIEIPRPKLPEEMDGQPFTNAPPLLVPSEIRWNPHPGNAYPESDFKVDALAGDGAMYAPDLHARERENFWQEPELKVLIVDPSGGGSDETAWGVLCQHLGLVGLVSVDARLEGFSAETLTAIAQDAARWKVHHITIEKNFGGGMFGELLRPYLFKVGHPCGIEEENAGQTQKEVRIIDTLQPVISSHRLWLAADVLRKDWEAGKDYPTVEAAKRRFYRLTYQLTRMTKVRGAVAHDDRVDMLATGVAKFIGTLRRQTEQAAQENHQAWLQAEAEKIIAARRAQGLPLFGLDSSSEGSSLGKYVRHLVGGLSSSPYSQGRR